jgi:hypothetical protein
MPDLPLVIVKHPIGGLTAAQVQQRSQDAYEQVIVALTRELR